jgi:hypothetical protein
MLSTSASTRLVTSRCNLNQFKIGKPTRQPERSPEHGLPTVLSDQGVDLRSEGLGHLLGFALG